MKLQFMHGRGHMKLIDRQEEVNARRKIVGGGRTWAQK